MKPQKTNPLEHLPEYGLSPEQGTPQGSSCHTEKNSFPADIPAPASLHAKTGETTLPATPPPHKNVTIL